LTRANANILDFIASS